MMARGVRLLLQIVGAVTVVAAIVVALALLALPGWLQVEDVAAKSDVIVVLAGDDHRLLKAIDLYRRGYAPRILLSNERQRPPSRFRRLMDELGYQRVDPREVRARVLAHAGVPPEAVGEFGTQLVSTVQEAEALRDVLGGRRVTAILVTSPFHARRAKLIYEDVMPRNRFLVVSPPESRIKSQWWRDQDSALRILNETAKILWFWSGGVFRSAPDSRAHTG